MKMLGVTASETMLVGDSIRRDIVPAKGLGMLAVHAVYGHRNFHEEEKDVADFVVRGIGREECERELTTNDSPQTKVRVLFPFFGSKKRIVSKICYTTGFSFISGFS